MSMREVRPNGRKGRGNGRGKARHTNPNFGATDSYYETVIGNQMCSIKL